MTPAVSVVIPCFNLGAYLDEAVQSVLRQTFDDYEIVIVDDGSDDAVTRHLLASYRRPHTRIIATENRGVASARNTGLAEARGRYVSFLDADDMYEPRFLERTIGRLEADDSLAFASCWLTSFGEREFTWEPRRCDFPWLLAEDTVCTASPTAREALAALGGFDEDERLDGYEDWDLAISLVAGGFVGEIVPEHLFRYRIRAESKSAVRTRSANHGRVMEYLLDKHAGVYAEHADGVLEAIGERTAELERLLPDEAPPRPAPRDTGWRDAILELEAHRRGLEEIVVGAPAYAPTQPAVVDFGSLRRLEPVSRVWGLDRGQPIDRYYIDRFLEAHAESIAGDVLEVKDPGYTFQFGTRARSASVLDIAAHNPEATIVADLGEPDALPAERYDCILLVQTVHFVFDFAAAIANVERALAPGGCVLATLPCVSRVDYEPGVDGDFWRFTAASARRVFEEAFGAERVEVETFGNVLSGTAFLQGMASSDLEPAELDRVDPYFPVLIAVRATKAGGPRETGTAGEGAVERVTCGEVIGWARDPSAPEKRLRLQAWAGDQELGQAWADADRNGSDGDAERRHRFRVEFDPRLHSANAQVEVRLPDGEVLPGAPDHVECVCKGARALRGGRLESPVGGAEVSPPWVDVYGWALGADAPVTAVELSHAGRVFRRVPVDVARPDLTEAFPDLAWAGTAGFAARISLLATGSGLDLAAHAVLADGERASIGSVQTGVGQALPVVVAVAGAEALGPLLGQGVAVARAVVAGGTEPPTQPGFAAGTWNQALDDPEALVWLCPGPVSVAAEFLGRAASALAERPDLSFAVAVAREQDADGGLTAVLSGRALGHAMLVRASAARAVGGIDEGAPDVVAAQWELAIRMAEAGHEWAGVEVPLPVGEPALVESGDEQGTRWLYRKHAPLFGRDLTAVLLDREAAIGRLLKDNHLMERALEAGLVPRITARRRERDRLAGKLRRSRAEATDGAATDDAASWGDFRRLEPLSEHWGSDRGLCVDRHYIDRFLESHAGDIRGRVLEVHQPLYSSRYGRDQVTSCDVLDVDPTNPDATLIADLRDAADVPSDVYDCVVLTQVLQYIDDPAAALAECRRVLRPGGVLLATVPCAARIDPTVPSGTEYWRWGFRGFQELLIDVFGEQDVDVLPEGNRVTVFALLTGAVTEEVPPELLEMIDPTAPVVLTARAVAPGEGDE